MLKFLRMNFYPDDETGKTFPCLRKIAPKQDLRMCRVFLDVKPTIDSMSLYWLPLIVFAFVAAKELTVTSLHPLMSLNVPVLACLPSGFVYGTHMCIGMDY